MANTVDPDETSLIRRKMMPRRKIIPSISFRTLRTKYRVFSCNFRIRVATKMCQWENVCIHGQPFLVIYPILSKSSNRPLSFLSFFFKHVSNLTIMFAHPDGPVCQ